MISKSLYKLLNYYPKTKHVVT